MKFGAPAEASFAASLDCKGTRPDFTCPMNTPTHRTAAAPAFMPSDECWRLDMAPAELRVQPAPAAQGGDAAAVHIPLARSAVAALLRHAPPTALEIERAIEVVEDAVMPARARLPAALQLATADARLLALAGHAGVRVPAAGEPPAWLPSAAIEQLFNRLAALAEGRPAAQDALPADADSAATLVLVRELMHHWALPGIGLLAG